MLQYIVNFTILSIFSLQCNVHAVSVTSQLKTGDGTTSDGSVHVALVSGCDSHLSALTPIANALLHHSTGIVFF